MQSVAVTWGGAVSSSGVLEAPAGAIEGETLTITATIEDCVVSKVISITDGTPGEQSEGAFCLRNPLNCLTEGLGQATGFGGVSLEAEEWASTNRDALGGGISSGCADAARHTYWNALLALEYSQEFAKGLTDAHEYSNIQNGCLDNAMDIHNNGVGRDIAQRLGPDATRQQIQQAVVDALKNGDLVSTLGGSNVPTGSCNVTYTP